MPVDVKFVELYMAWSSLLDPETTSTKGDLKDVKVEVEAHEYQFFDVDCGLQREDREEIVMDTMLKERRSPKPVRVSIDSPQREDMLVCENRLLLEYARVMGDRRAGLVWIEGLVNEG